MQLPIADLHCDLLSYMATVPQPNPLDPDQIACALPLLLAGGVRAQVMAIYTDVHPGSMLLACRQADLFAKLLEEQKETLCRMDSHFIQHFTEQSYIGVIAAIENAAGIGTQAASWQEIYAQFDLLLEKVGQLAYISLTHHTENRFGGGNYTEGIGLKEDGKRLLDYLAGKGIPIDLSHTSDLLAEGILQHIDRHHLPIPVIASHSNFRTLWDHKRNLTDEFAKEVIHREGLIGVNFLRAFLDDQQPERLFEHLTYGANLGPEAISFGADFFYTKDFPDQSRHPFYFPLAEDASKYPSILSRLEENLSEGQLRKLGYENVFHFYQNLWS
jgi:microsomal dipeptidase-like Zn-dependent dipeptidase